MCVNFLAVYRLECLNSIRQKWLRNYSFIHAFIFYKAYPVYRVAGECWGGGARDCAGDLHQEMGYTLGKVPVHHHCHLNHKYTNHATWECQSAKSTFPWTVGWNWRRTYKHTCTLNAGIEPSIVEMQGYKYLCVQMFCDRLQYVRIFYISSSTVCHFIASIQLLD